MRPLAEEHQERDGEDDGGTTSGTSMNAVITLRPRKRRRASG